MRGEREHAWQVNELQAGIANFRDADMFFNRNPGIVSGFLPHTGQPVKKRAFSGIGVTDNRDTCRWLSAYGDLVSRYEGDCFLTHQVLREKRRNALPARAATKLRCRTS